MRCCFPEKVNKILSEKFPPPSPILCCFWVPCCNPLHPLVRDLYALPEEKQKDPLELYLICLNYPIVANGRIMSTDLQDLMSSITAAFSESLSPETRKNYHRITELLYKLLSNRQRLPGTITREHIEKIKSLCEEKNHEESIEFIKKLSDPDYKSTLGFYRHSSRIGPGRSSADLHLQGELLTSEVLEKHSKTSSS